MYFQKLAGLGLNPSFLSDFMSSNFCYVSLHNAWSCGSCFTGRKDIFKQEIAAVSIIRSLAEISCY